MGIEFRIRDAEANRSTTAPNDSLQIPAIIRTSHITNWSTAQRGNVTLNSATYVNKQTGPHVFIFTAQHYAGIKTLRARSLRPRSLEVGQMCYLYVVILAPTPTSGGAH